MCCSFPSLLTHPHNTHPHHKHDTQAGNNAFHQQQYTQAIQHYEAALALSIDDPRLAAVLHCNKAAALHEQGHYIEAVVQCCIAESYDGGYSRVYQRRAEAYSSLGDYTAALRVCVWGGGVSGV